MRILLQGLLTSAAMALVVGIATWLVTIPLRRRSASYGLASVVLVGTMSSVAGLVTVSRHTSSLKQMLVTIGLPMLAGLAASAAAGLSARELVRDRQRLINDVAELEAGRVPRIDPNEPTRRLNAVRKQLEETGRRLSESREREHATEASRRELVTFLSHDLRTPLAGLRAMAEALEDGLADPVEDYYRQIRIEVERLSSMVNDLFDISRIQAGILALDTENLSLDDVVSDCVAALGPVAAANGIALAANTSGSVTVAGDGQQLTRAVSNLLANAIRHTKTGGTVTVNLRSEGDVATITVADECGGIPDEELARVFEIGFRGESARTPERRETVRAGFGLAIAQGIATAHQGTISVHNVAGGCCFALQLPAHPQGSE